MKTQKIIFRYICIYVVLLFPSIALANGNKIVGLTCENLQNPLGIESENPLLGWRFDPQKEADLPSAFQIIVSDNLEDIKNGKGNMWDSGKTISGETTQQKYNGERLKAQTRYFWCVRSYNNQGTASEWSEPAFFEMGIIHPSNWMAQWIEDGERRPRNILDLYRNDAAPLFRKEWTIKKPIASARLYITAPVYYETYLNGQKVGDFVLTSGQASSPKTALYNTFDVTALLKPGKNCWGICLGHKTYETSFNELLHCFGGYQTGNRPSVYGQLIIRYTDGHLEYVLTDLTWKTIPGPIRQNSLYGGECYDARAEVPGWNQPGAILYGWRNVSFANSPVKILQPQMFPPLKGQKLIKPVGISRAPSGGFIVDMGQNFTGIVQLKIQGKRGTPITFLYGEQILPDGEVNASISVVTEQKGNNSNSSPATVQQKDTYILRGEGKTESWHPRFTLHKFRYVEITGIEGELSPENITGIVYSSD